MRFADVMQVNLNWLITGKGGPESLEKSEKLAETIAAIAHQISPEMSKSEALKWGKKGEFIQGLA